MVELSTSGCMPSLPANSAAVSPLTIQPFSISLLLSLLHSYPENQPNQPNLLLDAKRASQAGWFRRRSRSREPREIARHAVKEQDEFLDAEPVPARPAFGHEALPGLVDPDGALAHHVDGDDDRGELRTTRPPRPESGLFMCQSAAPAC